MFDIKLCAEVFERFVVELSTVVYNDGSWEAKLTDYRFSYKFSSLSFSDLSY